MYMYMEVFKTVPEMMKPYMYFNQILARTVPTQSVEISIMVDQYH